MSQTYEMDCPVCEHRASTNDEIHTIVVERPYLLQEQMQRHIVKDHGTDPDVVFEQDVADGEVDADDALVVVPLWWPQNRRDLRPDKAARLPGGEDRGGNDAVGSSLTDPILDAIILTGLTVLTITSIGEYYLPVAVAFTAIFYLFLIYKYGTPRIMG